MTKLNDFIKNFLSHMNDDNVDVTFCGVLDRDTIDSMKYHIDNNEYIERVEPLYSDEDSPYEPYWFDIEGIGYGWIWATEKEKPELWKGMIADSTIRELEYMLDNCQDKVAYFVMQSEDKVIYHFVNMDFDEDGGYRRDMTVSMSDKEMDFF